MILPRKSGTLIQLDVSTARSLMLHFIYLFKYRCALKGVMVLQILHPAIELQKKNFSTSGIRL